MSYYEDRFDTDWDTLDRDEATDRAFALGVAAALGEHHDEEYEAIRAEMGSAYDESMVELAYDEGQSTATERQREVDDADEDAVWQWTLSQELEDVEPPDRDDDDEQDRATDLPSAVADQPEATERPDPDPEQTDFPDFLE